MRPPALDARVFVPATRGLKYGQRELCLHQLLRIICSSHVSQEITKYTNLLNRAKESVFKAERDSRLSCKKRIQ